MNNSTYASHHEKMLENGRSKGKKLKNKARIRDSDFMKGKKFLSKECIVERNDLNVIVCKDLIKYIAELSFIRNSTRTCKKICATVYYVIFYGVEVLYSQVQAKKRRWQIRDILHRLYRPLLQTEQMLLKMTHLYTVINQIVFFTLCDRAIGSNEKINSVYSLMLYNVFAYCLQYVKDMIEKEDWSPYVNVSEHSNVRHLAMTATKIVLEWTKAVTFVITIVFLVLTFSAKEGLEKFHPTVSYTIFTFLHYGATEKTFFEMFPKFLSKLELNVFESLETLWAPVILKLYTIIISAVFVAFQIGLKNYRLAICGVYVNVILCWKDADKNCFQDLKRELELLGKFKDASSRQLASFDDICSVCLCPMKAAKVTPCQHLFHGDCLRRCLKSRGDCPICKRELIPSYG